MREWVIILLGFAGLVSRSWLAHCDRRAHKCYAICDTLIAQGKVTPMQRDLCWGECMDKLSE